jgi:hypothetical protein
VDISQLLREGHRARFSFYHSNQKPLVLIIRGGFDLTHFGSVAWRWRSLPENRFHDIMDQTSYGRGMQFRCIFY